MRHALNWISNRSSYITHFVRWDLVSRHAAKCHCWSPMPWPVIVPDVGVGRVVVEAQRWATRVPGSIDHCSCVSVIRMTSVQQRILCRSAQRFGTLFNRKQSCVQLSQILKWSNFLKIISTSCSWGTIQ